MQQSPQCVFPSRCKSFSRCEQTRGESSLTKFYCENKDKQRNSPRHTKLNCHYSANPTTVCRKNGSPCVKWPLNLTRFPLHSLSSCLSRLLYYWKAYTSKKLLSCIEAGKILRFSTLTSFPMISALTIFAPMSFKSFSVIFFAGITTGFFSSTSSSELELMSVSGSSFTSGTDSLSSVRFTSGGGDPFSVPISAFFLHPPEELELGLS